MRESSPGRIGYFCSYFPREILYAFGKIPVRGFPVPGSRSASEPYVHPNSCSLVKGLLATYLEDGRDPGLEAVIFTDSCDAIRRMCDVWRQYLDVEILDFIDIPRLRSPLGIDRFAEILGGLVARLEDRFDCSLEPDALSEAIETFDAQRELMAELRQRRSEGRVGWTEYYSWIRRLLQEDPAEAGEALREGLASLNAM